MIDTRDPDERGGRREKRLHTQTRATERRRKRESTEHDANPRGEIVSPKLHASQTMDTRWGVIYLQFAFDLRAKFIASGRRINQIKRKAGKRVLRV